MVWGGQHPGALWSEGDGQSLLASLPDAQTLWTTEWGLFRSLAWSCQLWLEDTPSAQTPLQTQMGGQAPQPLLLEARGFQGWQAPAVRGLLLVPHAHGLLYLRPTSWAGAAVAALFVQFPIWSLAAQADQSAWRKPERQPPVWWRLCVH